MLLRNKAVVAAALCASLLADTASALPRAGAPAGGQSLIVEAGRIVCDANGCQTYETETDVFVEPPPPRRRPPPPPGYDGGYDDPYGDPYDDPTIVVRPRVERRIYIDPAPPPPPRVNRRIYVDPAPDYPEPVRVLSRAHVRWCLQRYRSYNPRTDLYLARKNVYRRCISPYS